MFIFYLCILLLFCIATGVIFILTFRKKEELGWLAGLSSLITGLLALIFLYWDWNLFVLIVAVLFILIGVSILIVYPKKSSK